MNRSSTLENQINIRRVLMFAVVLLVVITIYITRLFSFQILNGSYWQARANDNRLHTINIQAPRGIIYDRNNTILARNIAAYNIVITPSDLPDDPGEIQQIYRELSQLIGVPVSQGELSDADPYVPCESHHGITQIVEYGDTTTPYEPVKIKCDVDRTLAMTVEERSVDWPGVSVQTVPVRDYPTGLLTADIIGYLGPISKDNEEKYTKLNFIPNRDKIGYAGLERSLQDILAGQNGIRTVEWDVGGQVLNDVEAPILAKPGNNVRLTIDTRLQEAAYNIVQDEINSWNLYFRDKPSKQMTSAVTIALNPRTGEILAMISYPSYENNRMARFIPSYYYKQLEADQRKPLLNHAVGDELPAGSVFKLTTAVGGLNEGVITPEQVLETPGVLYITEKASPNDPGKERRFVDWNWQKGGFGHLDFIHAVSNSSNVYFYKVGGGYKDEVPQGLGICRLGAYAKALGYGEYPGTELPEEVDGSIPTPTEKRKNLGESWTIGDTYLSSVGQGYVLATPLQVLLSAATISMDGKLMQPTLVREVLDGEGNVIQPFQPKMRWDLTKDPVIVDYEAEPGITGCVKTDKMKTVAPWIFDKIHEGMRLAVLEGTLKNIGFDKLNIAVAGKTGTAEYCDEFARKYTTCEPGNWPTHAWTIAYAPFDNPEIAVVAFVYNGGEGAIVAGPIIQRVMQSYFELKAIDNKLANP